MANPKMLFIALLTLFTGVSAFWRMECPARVGLARIDPIVSKGMPSQHAHAIFGSNGTFYSRSLPSPFSPRR